MTDIVSSLNSRKKPVLVFDGAMGTSLQLQNLNHEDFGGVNLEGCNENLVRTSPKSVEYVHNSFLEAGCDVIETNTFGATSVVLVEYGLETFTKEINILAAQIAKKCCTKYSTSSKPRYVAGSIGPTTKLPTLGHIDFDTLRISIEEQALSLFEGGVDLFVLETCQDILQVKAGLLAINNVFEKKGSQIPVMVSVTMETTGTMLVGSDIASVVTTLQPFNIDILGLNCATGPEQMKSYIKYLSDYSPFKISCIPNAGLPENIGGKAFYRLTPLDFKLKLINFIKDYGVQIVGGCCGTTPEHIKTLVQCVDEIKTLDIDNNSSIKRFEPSISSLYEATNYRQDNSFLIIGERLNASGSRKVKQLLEKNDWEGLISIAKSQQKENAHILDVNVDFVGRDGVKDMDEIVSRLVTQINLPLMLDSTDYEKMEAGLKRAGGKCILNSTNFEDGPERFFRVLNLARSYGAAIVIGTIDEEGMARTAKKKFEISKRSYEESVNFGISENDIFFDPLVLPVTTGIEEDRSNALETIKAISMIKESYSNVHIVLGISNVSFGLNSSARVTLNSVFLDECIKAGLDSAIISPSKILPLSKISQENKDICLELIYDKRVFKENICTSDPLTQLTTVFTDEKFKNKGINKSKLQSLPIEERLKEHIIEGERIDLEKNLNEALSEYKALDIINKFLLGGMKVVGDQFASGQMQLPFVLQSAETMKYAVSILEPYMEKKDDENSSKGRFLIATVKGDVHDIGKNLVDIILSNNGYEVINLGIKQDISAIIDAQVIHKADCIAMSGLLVKSTAFMKENLEALNEVGISVPVVLGGAALTPKFVNQDCSSIYKGKVIYGKDAFTDLRFMEAYMNAKQKLIWDDYQGFKEITKENSVFYSNPQIKSTKESNKRIEKNNSNSLESSSFIERSILVPSESPIRSPFLGTKIINSNSIEFEDLTYYLDLNALIQGQWQFKRKRNQSTKEYIEFVHQEVHPILNKWLSIIKDQQLINPSCLYGYFPCGRSGNSIKVFDPSNNEHLGTFKFPRQKAGNRYCISDYFNDLNNDNPTDIIPMQVVTMGDIASTHSLSLYKENKYSDYLFYHGLTVQLTEALAEYNHALIRSECGFKDDNKLNIKDILAQRYRGCRYSFGYPACPNVLDSKFQLNWLDSSRVGVTMDESEQLHPEQTTTALIALHSNAKYFSA